jgi:TonB family protein
LPSGDYVLDTQLAGFAPVRRSITIASEDAQLDLRLEIGALQETVAVIGGPNDSDAPALVVLDPEAQRVLDQRRLKRATATCPPEPTNAGDTNRIGGNIRAPMKIRDAKPHYPSSLRGTGLAGTVVLQGRIGTDGTMEELNVLSSTHPDFVAPASEAVAQWQFDQTLLNCVPMPVNITVTVNFSYLP